MEKANRKKMAKAAILTAGLTMGAIVGQSVFNEAQATGFGYNLFMCYKGYGCSLNLTSTCGSWAPCG